MARENALLMPWSLTALSRTGRQARDNRPIGPGCSCPPSEKSGSQGDTLLGRPKVQSALVSKDALSIRPVASATIVSRHGKWRGQVIPLAAGSRRSNSWRVIGGASARARSTAPTTLMVGADSTLRHGRRA
jgi:hypothetical protein